MSHPGFTPGQSAQCIPDHVRHGTSTVCAALNIATRFDKLAITYGAGVTLCAILTWVRLLGDTT